MSMSCGMLQANGSQGADETHKNASSEFFESIPVLARALAEQDAILLKAVLVESELNDYKDENSRKYKAALVEALRDNSTAIDDLFNENEKEYNKEEAESKKNQDDSSVGYWGTNATLSSRNGIIRHYFTQRKTCKAAINAGLKETFNGHFNTFNTLVIPVLEKEVVHKNYEMDETFLQSLERCGDNGECLCEANVYLSEIKKEGFFDRFNFAALKPAMALVKEKGTPLTDDQIIMIAQTKIFQRGQRELSMQSLDDSKKKVLAKLDDILNPKKKDVQSLIFGKDIKNDQDDQGALSQ